jgi:2-amino-4-hydroxy-6-hydroxymethyldihydropteridine diphosphokinase
VRLRSGRRAYIALGSNLGDSRGQLLAAIDAIAGLPETHLLKTSRLYRTPPWGVLEQPPFVNAAISVDTSLAPEALLDALLAIEQAAGRVRDGERWGPRTLDLDLLHVDGVTLHGDRLILPHPRIAERAFVLLPLCDLDPELELPALGIVKALLGRVDTAGCEWLP